MRRLSLLLFLLCVTCVPSRCPALDVLVNQVGYEPGSPKIFHVQRTADYAADGTFSVKRVSDNVEVYSGSLTRKGGLWNKYYWEGDFSSFSTTGDYYVSGNVNGEIGTSYNFTISPGVLLSVTGVPTYQYFTAQRCGTAVSFQYKNRAGNMVTWSHNSCHTDDGYMYPSGPYLDTAGGWHDSGEYQKYAQFFGGHAVYDLLTLYDSNRSYCDGIDVINNTGGTGSNGIPDILDEALWQARWLAKMVDSNGHVMKQISMRRGGASWVKPENDTDRVIGTSDDRWVEIGDCVTPTEIIVCSSLIKMHRVLASKGMPTENFGSKALAIWNHRVALAISEGGHNNLGDCGHHIFAGIDLYAVYGQQNCWDRAVQRVDEMANAVISNPACYDDAFEGLGYDLAAIAMFARNYPSNPKAALARTAVQALMARNITLATNPVGLITRLENGQYQYLPINPSLGSNRLYGTVAWAAIEAYKIIGDPTYLRFALDQYNWILGSNYFRTCMMEAVGDSYVNKYHTRYDTFITNGIEPGVVINGYIRDANGIPWLDFGTGSVSAQANESWLPNSAAYAAALAGMSIFRDGAQMVSDTIPTTMNRGQSLPVSVTVTNTGSLTWTAADGYKLGAVGDSDPFASNRVNLGPSDSIGAGQQKTFTFTMTAPSTVGTYTTDWQMLHEGTGWFGDILTKTVMVSGPPVTIQSNTFDSDANGWNISLWQQGGVSPTMGWVAGAGCPGGAIQCVGAGMTDSTGAGLREGGEMWKIISTASDGGYSNISVLFDVKVNGLGNDYSGVAGTGDHGLLEEQLTVSFSTDGGSTWTEAGYLNRAALSGLQTCGTRSFDLTGYPACNNNPSFAVKFRWQLNTGPESPSGADIANIDNVTIKGTGAPDMTPPGNVTGFTATSGDRQNTLNWTNPGDADLAGVKIMFKTSGYPTGPTDPTATVVYDNSGVSCVHTGLTNGLTYYYKAFAYDEIPNYASGAQASAIPADVIPPGPVTGFTATAGDTRVILSWGNPTDPDFTGTKILFKIGAYPAGPNDATATVICDTIGTSHTHTGLTNGVTYYYSAFAHDAIPNYSTASNASATPLYIPPPGPVTNFKAYGGNGQVTLNWTNPPDPGLAGVKIVFKTTSYPLSPTDGDFVYDALGTSCVHTGLINGTKYYYAAYAYTGPTSYSGGAQAPAHAAADATIPAAKALANNQVRAIRGSVVTAVFSGSFYIQTPASDGPYGLKVSPAEAVSVGQKVDIVGLMSGQGMERYLNPSGNAVKVTQADPLVTIAPAALNNKAVGGANLNAYTPGVVGGTGPNNIGLLVRVFGRVTQRDTSLQYFYIDDGCGLKDGTKTGTVDNVGIRIKANPTDYPTGSYVVVTGISSPSSSSGLRPQILPLPQPTGVQIVGP